MEKGVKKRMAFKRKNKKNKKRTCEKYQEEKNQEKDKKL